jgi:hypothetical protein
MQCLGTRRSRGQLRETPDLFAPVLLEPLPDQELPVRRNRLARLNRADSPSSVVNPPKVPFHKHGWAEMRNLNIARYGNRTACSFLSRFI